MNLDIVEESVIDDKIKFITTIQNELKDVDLDFKGIIDQIDENIAILKQAWESTGGELKVDALNKIINNNVALDISEFGTILDKIRNAKITKNAYNVFDPTN